MCQEIFSACARPVQKLEISILHIFYWNWTTVEIDNKLQAEGSFICSKAPVTSASQGLRKLQLLEHSHKPTVEIINKIIHVCQVFQIIHNLLTWASLLTDYVSCNYMEVWIMSFFTDTHTHIHGSYNKFYNFSELVTLHTFYGLSSQHAQFLPLTETTVSVQGQE